MNILKRIFNNIVSNKRPEIFLQKSYAEGYVAIPSLHFFGQYHTSPNGEWTVAWSESPNIGKSSTVVVQNNSSSQITCHLRSLVRPNAGHISNSGMFSIEDWSSHNLSGVFSIFNANGDGEFSISLNANIFNSAISNHGLLAAVQTANNYDHEDGNKLTVVDIKNKEILFSVNPETGWADDYVFDESNKTIRVSLKDLGDFRYDSFGNFLDGEEYLSARLNSRQYNQILMSVEILLARNDPNDIPKLISAIDRARQMGANDDKSWSAVSFKLEGIAYEIQGELNKSVHAFENAIALNPKIGVKRKMDAIKKKLIATA